ncbi:MAG TPA: GDSL-type esterase/lipase family protein [Candidatus Limnocylindrales bacterium]|nr:GDSL-type esterase/lipase family protein [Candidatus Limnocylindrales bacterium]
MKQIVQKIALAFGGILFALALCEGLIWVTPPKLLPARLHELTKRMALYRSTDGMFIADSELLFKIRPNYDAVVDHPDYHVRVKTHLNLDGIGFRGGNSGGPAWAAAVGDSFTFGVGVEQEDTWVYLLSKALSREIINLGIPAQGPAQYTRVLKHYALPIRPKVVFYGFYFNDLDAANRFYRMKRTVIPVNRYLRQYSVLYNLIGDSRAAVAQEPAPSPSDGAELIRRTLERQNGNFEHRWQLTVKELDAALRASQEAQIELVMLYLPSRWEVYWESIKARNRLPGSLDIDRLRRTVVEYCGARKIVCFDLTPALKQAARQGKELYFPIDGHWNKEGNRLVAEALKNYLTEKGLTG